MTDMKPRRPRRRQGEGSLFKRSSDGRWVGSMDINTADGKRRQKWVTSTSRKECLRKLDELRSELKSGVDVDRRLTVASWMETWLEIHRLRVKPNTFTNDQAATRHVCKHLGNRRLKDLTPDDVRSLHKALGVGRSRTVKAHNALAQALDKAVATGKIVRNVARIEGRPAENTVDREPFGVDTAKAVLAHALTLPDMEAARWMCALLQGTRPGESLGLRWAKVNLDRGTAEVSWQLQKLPLQHGCGDQLADDDWPCGRKRCCTPKLVDTKPGFTCVQLMGSYHLVHPKTSASNRVVPLVGPLVETLKRLKEADDANPAGNPHGLVFRRPNGLPVDSVKDRQAWAQLLIGAGAIDDGDDVPDLYSARHTAATLLEAAGVPESVRMQILGHVSIRAHRGYAHGDLEQNRAAIGTLEHLFDNSTETPDADPAVTR